MSDSPTSPSGYGNVTRFVCPGLAAHGHDVALVGWQTTGRPARWRGCTLYPSGRDPFGADVLVDYLRRLRPDVLVTQGDAWRLAYVANPVVTRLRREARIPWALYTPLDTDMGDGRLPRGLARLLRGIDLPLTTGRYGRRVMRANGVAAACLPYGVDTRLFRPAADRDRAKRRLGYEGRFVVLSDARNQIRKLWPRALEIFRRFAAGKHDVLLHVHCDPDDPAARRPEYRYNLRADVAFLGLTAATRFTAGLTPADGLPLEGLASLYRAADVHLLASYGEGFGLPTLQAAASGVVPLAGDAAASRELVRGHGEAIRIRDFVRGAAGMRHPLVDIDDAVARLERLYRDRRRLEARARAARRFAEAYDWQRIVPRWDALLRREVPRLQARVGRRGWPGARLGVTRAGASRRARLPAPLRKIVDALERLGGSVSAGIVRDLARSPGAFTIPVTLPAIAPRGRRVTGRVYLASRRDLPVFRALRRIFPGLRARRATARPDDDTVLASSTLALDVGGVSRRLPGRAARLGVPCIGPTGHAAQKRLWPALSLETAEVKTAARLGRWMLTDHGEAAAQCAAARARQR